jgi:hypothetical protein
VGDALQHAEVSSNTVVLEVPTPLQAEHALLVFPGGMTIGAAPWPP